MFLRSPIFLLVLVAIVTGQESAPHIRRHLQQTDDKPERFRLVGFFENLLSKIFEGRSTPLEIDEVISDGKPSTVFALDQLDEIAPDETIQVFQFTEGDVKAGSTLDCTLKCASSGSDGTSTKHLAFKEGGVPNDFYDNTVFEDGPCPLGASYVLKKNNPLFILASSFDASGVADGVLTCSLTGPPAPPVPAPLPIPAPVPIPVPQPAPQPAPVQPPQPAPSPVVAPVPAPSPVAPVPQPQPQPQPIPAPIPAPQPQPQPIPAPQPQPQPIPAPVPSPVPVQAPAPVAEPTFQVDQVLTSGVASTTFNLAAYSSASENPTIQVFQFTDSTVEVGSTVSCRFECTGTTGSNRVSWKQGSQPPRNLNDYTRYTGGRCPVDASFTLTQSQNLYVYVTSFGETIDNGKVTCSLGELPAPAPAPIPTLRPTPQPVLQPVVQPSPQPVQQPTPPPVLPPVVQPTPSPVLPPVVQPSPQPVFQPVQQPTSPPGNFFRLRLYWEQGYMWQESPREMFFCAFYNYQRSFCWYNNVEQRPCRDDQMYVDQCNARFGDGLYQFIFIGNDEVMIQTTNNLCWEASGSQIFLRTCNQNNGSQRWRSPRGSFTGNRFEISPDGNRCVTQAHHPKNREVVEIHSCATARDSDTAFWQRY